MNQDLHGLLLQMTLNQPHPNVVQHLDFLVGQDFLCVVLERLQGQLLSQFIQKRPEIPEGNCRSIMSQTMSALSYIHSSSVRLIHRDVKLDSLWVRSTDSTSPSVPQVVMVDFGICCPADP